jgi:hypothetical protein
VLLMFAVLPDVNILSGYIYKVKSCQFAIIWPTWNRRHDTRHNVIQLEGLICDTQQHCYYTECVVLFIAILNVIMKCRCWR